MKKQLIGFVLLFLICVLMPSGATAGFSIGIYATPRDGEPGDSFTFPVSVQPIQQGGGSAEGQTVTFSVSPDDGTVSLSSTSATIDSNGQASITLSTGSGSSGSYRVTATFNGLSVGSTVTVGTSQPPPPPEPEPPPPPPPPELSISVISGPGAGKPGESLTFTVEVQEGGSPVSGKAVRFSITSGDGNASVGPSSTLTDSNGRAQTALTLGNSASGSYTITATITTSVGNQSVSGTATVKSSSPPSHTIVLYISNSGALQPGDSVTFTAEVKEGGNAASGETVTFSVSPDNGTASLSNIGVTTGRGRTGLHYASTW